MARMELAPGFSARHRVGGWFVVADDGEALAGPYPSAKSVPVATLRRITLPRRIVTDRVGDGVVRVRVRKLDGRMAARTGQVRRLSDTDGYSWETRGPARRSPLYVAAVIAAASDIDESEAL